MLYIYTVLLKTPLLMLTLVYPSDFFFSVRSDIFSQSSLLQ